MSPFAWSSLAPTSSALLFLAGAAAALVAALLAVAAASCARWLRSAPPAAGSRRVLPNGMAITQWSDLETDFLWGEIWGPASEYGRAGGVLFRAGATVVDAGANVGLFSLYAAYRCRGHATVVAFEPVPTTHAVLAANAAAAERGEFDAVFRPARPGRLRVHAPPVGVGAAEGELVLAHHPHLSIWSTADAGLAAARLARVADDIPRAVAASPNALVRACVPACCARAAAAAVLGKVGQTVAVRARVRPLSDVIDELGLARVDLLKVDVEGGELAVLAGVRDEHWPRVQQVVLEAEDFAAAAEMRRRLAARGFRVTARATERERTPGVLSEVSMVYAVRPAYVREVEAGGGEGVSAEAAAAAAAAAAPAAAAGGGARRGGARAGGAAASSPAPAPAPAPARAATRAATRARGRSGSPAARSRR